MKVKSYTAETVAEALQYIRQDMGGNAIVLKTRKAVNSKGAARVEVIACVNDELQDAASADKVVPKKAAQTAPLKKSAAPNIPETISVAKKTETPSIVPNRDTRPDTRLDIRLDSRLERIERIMTRFLVNPMQNKDADELNSFRTRLKDSEFSSEFIESLIHDSLMDTAAETDTDLTTSIKSGLVRRLASVMQPSIELKEGDKVLFIGPCGSGKSSMMGKLAAHLIGRQKSKVRLASIDDFKIGGIEELNSYADLLGLQSYSSFEVAQTIKTSSSEIVLIDSPGLTSDAADRNRLFDRINELNPTHCVFVFSALTRSSDLYAMAEWGRAATPTHFAMTMMDLSNRYGAVMEVSEILNCKMLWTSDAPGGIGDIQAPDPNAMARKSLEIEEELCKV